MSKKTDEYKNLSIEETLRELGTDVTGIAATVSTRVNLNFKHIFLSEHCGDYDDCRQKNGNYDKVVSYAYNSLLKMTL